MNLACKVTAAHFDSQNLKYKITGEREDAIETGFGGLDNKGDIRMTIFFDEDNSSCAIRVFNFVNFSEEHKPKMYEVSSKMNEQYRWVKFYVDEKDNTITAATDAVIQLDSCGEEVTELILRIANICDKAFPEFMKGIWA